MGYKVTNKKAFINEEKNVIVDTIFFFETEKELNRYISLQEAYNGRPGEHGEVEVMTAEEESLYNFSSQGIPHIVIERPLFVNPGEPYWTTKRILNRPQEAK